MLLPSEIQRVAAVTPSFHPIPSVSFLGPYSGQGILLGGCEPDNRDHFVENLGTHAIH